MHVNNNNKNNNNNNNKNNSIKVKTAIKLYANEHPRVRMEREFEKKSDKIGRRSLKKDTERYA